MLKLTFLQKDHVCLYVYMCVCVCIYIYIYTLTLILRIPPTLFKKTQTKKDGSSSVHTLNLMYSPQMGPVPDETEECLLNSYCVPDLRAKIPPFA